ALPEPDDWVEVLDTAIPQVVEQAGVDADAVVGVGIDFTSCTVLPVTAEGTPLCTLERWRNHRHAWPKLWKHHAAQPVADRLNEVALERREPFLSRYGGRISSEWYFPKLIEVWLAEKLRLSHNTAVAVGNVDSFVSLPGAGVTDPGIYVPVVGTSTCEMVVHPDEIRMNGITGVVKDGILPGLYGYEAGQPAVGDMLAWFVETLGGEFGELERAAGEFSAGAT